MSAVRILREDPCSPDFKPLEVALHAWNIRKSDSRESHRLARELIAHALEFDEPLVTAWAYLTCGAHDLAGNELDDAEESIQSAVTLFERTGEERGQSLGVILRARVFMSRGNFNSALECYKSIIEREAHGLQTLERFEAFNGIAGCFWGLDKVELCLLYLSKAFDTLRNSDYVVERGTVLSNMGAALLSVGNHAAAVEFLEAARKFSASAGDRLLSFNILTNLVNCYTELKELEAALLISTQQLAEFQDLAFSGPSNSALCNAAIAFGQNRRWALADQCLLGARIIAEDTGLDIAHALASLAQSSVAVARGDYAVGATHAESILKRFPNTVTDDIRSQVLSLLIDCYQQTSRLDDVLSLKKQRLSLSDARYQSGLAAAIVVLDFKSSLKNASA